MRVRHWDGGGGGMEICTSLRPALPLPLLLPAPSHTLVPALPLGLCPIVLPPSMAAVSVSIAPVVASVAARRARAAAVSSVPGARAISPVVPFPVSVPVIVAGAIVASAVVVAVAPSVVAVVVWSVASSAGMRVSSVAHGCVRRRKIGRQSTRGGVGWCLVWCFCAR